jgi:hypothetical protein
MPIAILRDGRFRCRFFPEAIEKIAIALDNAGNRIIDFGERHRLRVAVMRLHSCPCV